MILAGRDALKLDAATAAARAAGGEVVGVRAASIDDPQALIDALDGAAVVINAAGPFVRTGAPVLRAAIAAGHALRRHHRRAAVDPRHVRRLRRGPASAPASPPSPGMGFDYVPGDLLCNLVGRTTEPLRQLIVAYDVHGFDPTRGTMRSSLEMLKGGDVVYEDGRWVPAPAGVTRASVVFPEPAGRQTVSRYPSGEQITVPRHVRTRRVVSLLSTRAVAPPGLERALPDADAGDLRRAARRPAARAPVGADRRPARGARRRSAAAPSRGRSSASPAARTGARRAAWSAAPTSTA